MTTFILHGGRVTDASGINKKFFQEIANRLPDGARMLCCYFANPTKIISAHDYIVEQIAACSEKHFIFEVANSNPAIFTEQMSRADAIYFHGGTTALLLEALRPIDDLSERFQNKLIIGSSAGAHMLSRYYDSVLRGHIGQGFEILPVKVMAHYSAEHHSELEMLKAHGELLETYALPEGEFVVIEK